MESRHCGQDKRIFFCPVHNASTPCSLQAFGIRCMLGGCSLKTSHLLETWCLTLTGRSLETGR